MEARCARADNSTDGGGGLRPPPPSVWLFFLLPCVCGVVFYVSARWCGAARVLEDVRREAQAGQRTRKARSQVWPCKPRYLAQACWLGMFYNIK